MALRKSKARFTHFQHFHLCAVDWYSDVKRIQSNNRLMVDGSAICLLYIDRYLPQDSSLKSETVHYKRGVCQQFCLPSHSVNLSEWSDEEVRIYQEYLCLGAFMCERTLDPCPFVLTSFYLLKRGIENTFALYNFTPVVENLLTVPKVWHWRLLP